MREKDSTKGYGPAYFYSGRQQEGTTGSGNAVYRLEGKKGRRTLANSTGVISILPYLFESFS
jgi:hypothetical protein